MSEEELYREVILDHYKNPRNKGRLEENQTTIAAAGTNPFCGDELELTLQVDEGKVTQVKITTKGCAISCSSASMMSELLEGKTLSELKSFIENFRRNMLGANGARWPEGWEDLETLEGVRKYPVRIKCALLSWNTLKQGIEDFQAQGEKQRVSSKHKEEQ